jgi:hypothetical protein
MKVELKNLHEGINLNKLSKKVGHLIVRGEGYVLLLIFAIFLGYCGYLWYGYVYDYQWDDAKKQEYINTQKSGVNFNQEKFEKVLGEITARQAEYAKEVEARRDIFNVK